MFTYLNITRFIYIQIIYALNCFKQLDNNYILTPIFNYSIFI